MLNTKCSDKENITSSNVVKVINTTNLYPANIAIDMYNNETIFTHFITFENVFFEFIFSKNLSTL